MFTTNLESAVRGEDNLDAIKETLIDWFDAFLKGHVDPTDLQEQAQIILDSLVKMLEHVCECEHDEEIIDAMTVELHDLRERVRRLEREAA